MKHLLFLFLLFTLIGCDPASNAETSEDQAPSTKPNVVLLVGDDQGYPYFGFMGADYVQTPNMDALAASGYLFTEGYVPQNHCRPSLQALITGTLPVDYGNQVEELISKQQIPDSAKVDFRFHAMQYFNTLPRILAKHGYQSFQGGKWWEFNYQNGGFDTGMTTGWT
ncbi:MAG: sulfatase-like hydrolase/transferase, partial [Bacteroidota bacterium]